MEWTNEKIIEFIELFETEPCLWDPSSSFYKNRAAQLDAWRSIVQTLSFKVSVEELKRKKESLMGYYRIHLNRYKKSLKLGDAVYTTNWFAFHNLDRFLRPIYGPNTTENIESFHEGSSTEEPIVGIQVVETDCNLYTLTTNNEEPQCITSDITEEPKWPRTQHRSTETNFEKHKPEISNTKELSRKDLDECDHFGCLIAAKIRKIDNTVDREILMNSIQNLVFEYYMKDKQTNVQEIQSRILSNTNHDDIIKEEVD